MRRATYVAVLVTIATAAMVLAGSSAAAAPGHAAAKTHVRAAGPSVVKQVGLRNYAGPNCPGAGWNCTTATRVLQIAAADGQNKVECTTEPTIVGANQSCVILQVGGSSNTARCVMRSSMPGAAQLCDITQTGASNKAFVDQSIEQKDGSEQAGTQKAMVKQGTDTAGSTGGNELHLSQDVKQESKTGDLQSQNAAQAAIVVQFSAVSGENAAHIDQSQNQKVWGGSNQAQNGADQTAFQADCTNGGFPSGANACANVSQVAVDGKNDNHVHQSIDEDANGSSDSAAIQRQGAFDGGLFGRVHQATATAKSENHVKQSKNLKMKGGGSQTQIDPVRCCGTASQEGGNGNREDIDQSSALSASQGNAFQSTNLQGDSRSVPGTCTISQKAKTDDNSANNDSGAVSPCPFLQLGTTCTSAGIETQGGCTTFQERPCEGIECDIDRQGFNFLSRRLRG